MRARDFIFLEKALQPKELFKYDKKYTKSLIDIATSGPVEITASKQPQYGKTVSLAPETLAQLRAFVNGDSLPKKPVFILDNGETITGSWGALEKTSTIKGGSDFKVNKGEITEGLHAIAAFARLIKRPSEPINLDDIAKIIDKIENNQTLILSRNEVTSDIADEFHITVRLKTGTWAALKDPRMYEYMEDLLDTIISDANEETSRFADRFASNQRYDVVRVIGDGVTGEKLRKTDVRFENEAEQKFADFSIKVSTPQIHQVGGGAKTLSPDQRFDIVQSVFNVDGKYMLADISASRDRFIAARSPEKAQTIAYEQAVQSLNRNMANPDDEKTFLNNLVAAIKFWATRNDPNVKIKEFTPSGTMILDINKIDQLLDNNKLNLVAYLDKGSQLPKIVVSDAVSKKVLIVFRTYRRSDGYIRNYIEKGNLFVDLTMSKFVPKQNKNIAPPNQTINTSNQKTSSNNDLSKPK